MSNRRELKWPNVQTNGTAKNFAGWDASQLPVEIPPASQADVVGGVDDMKPLTSASLEAKRSIKLVSISNGTSGTINIDCGGKQELTVVLSNIVTGAITLTFSNAANLELLDIFIPITGANINVTFPSTTRMAMYNEVTSGNGWYQASKIFQASSPLAGAFHEFGLKRFSSTLFDLRYNGAIRP